MELKAIKSNIEQQPHGEETGMYFTDFIYQLNKGLKIFVDNGTGEIIRKVTRSDQFLKTTGDTTVVRKSDN